MSSGFGNLMQQQQQQQQQRQQQAPSSGGGGLADSLGLGSLFGGTTPAVVDSNSSSELNDEDIENQSLFTGLSDNLTSMRSSLESQLPSKILGMNYQQRLQVFVLLLCLSVLFFGLGFVIGMPLLTVRPQKFALSFTCGSITFMSSFAILRGPIPHLVSMLNVERIHFTTIYITSMILTLYATFNVRGMTGYVMVLGCSALQLVALVWYLITFLPG
jgi:hypothetical protein